VPLERILIETDSPYLAPVPYRGKMNEPGYVPHVAEFIATLKDVPLREVADRTTENFFNLFQGKGLHEHTPHRPRHPAGRLRRPRQRRPGRRHAQSFFRAVRSTTRAP
jgi:hypothetical protein